MTIVNTVQQVCQWAHAQICKEIKLKLPDDKNVAETYSYQLVTPSCHPVYIPTKDRIPPDVGKVPVPSLLVQVLDSSEKHGSGALKLRFCFLVWDPGEHGRDKFTPEGDGIYVQNDDGTFVRTADGWQDAWNFLDIALRKLQNTSIIANCTIDQDKGIEYGPYTIDSDVPSFYPYWYVWLEFTLNYNQARLHNPDIEKFL